MGIGYSSPGYFALGSMLNFAANGGSWHEGRLILWALLTCRKNAGNWEEWPTARWCPVLPYLARTPPKFSPKGSQSLWSWLTASRGGRKPCASWASHWIPVSVSLLVKWDSRCEKHTEKLQNIIGVLVICLNTYLWSRYGVLDSWSAHGPMTWREGKSPVGIIAKSSKHTFS